MSFQEKLRSTNNICQLLLPQPAYPDSSDLSAAVPTVSSYDNDVLTLSLPVVDQQQVRLLVQVIFNNLQSSKILLRQITWADVSWLALYCRKLKIVFMSVNVPNDFSDEIIFG